MKHLVGEARPRHQKYNPEVEEGIICECGMCVYVKQEDRESITYIHCPNCGHITALSSGRLFNV